jgi:alpha-L-fucosidase
MAASAFGFGAQSRSLAEKQFGATSGPFQASWASLSQYETPEWFKDAKFGIWAHWGPQCVPAQGDWYARRMYIEGDAAYKYHVEKYGHPSKFGFKDVINTWDANEWDPEHLIGLYKKAGAKYFMALANHHDDFDNYNSKYQPWNSVKIGPKKDLVGGWAKACKKAGLRFATSIHAAHAYSWYETSQGADKTGAYAGVQYDGNISKDQGAGKWWDGLDPQALYAQQHKPGNLVWEWDENRGSSVPPSEYCEKFFNRVIDLVDKYDPDLLYFDDTILPLYPISDVGLRIAAYYYNRSLKKHGKVEGVITGKILTPHQRHCLVLDVERGVLPEADPLPWQSETCIGQWHYDENLYKNGWYKTVPEVVQMLVDTVSKNGNFMLNIPLKGSGAPDDKELAFLAGFTEWMSVNSEGIYSSRPWRIYAEGPASLGAKLNGQGFNEGRHNYASEDFRFMKVGKTLYAYAFALPENGQYKIKSLGTGSKNGAGNVESVELLGSGAVRFTRDADALTITLPEKVNGRHAFCLKINGTGLV